MKQKELTAVTLQQLEPDLYKIIYSDKIKIELEHVIEMDNHFEEMVGDEGVYCITDMQGRYFAFTNQAQKYLATDAKSVKQNLVKACAVILDNLANRLIAKFFMKFFKPAYPMKIVKSEEQALAWLEEVKLMSKQEIEL